jgi:type II secretory pathway pseudopilin PulG
MKNPRHNEKGMTLIEWIMVVFVIVYIVSSLFIYIIPKFHLSFRPRRLHRKMALVDLHKILMIYQQDYGCYPSVQPPETRYEKSGGVRDLYPLYTSGLLKPNELNKLLHHSKAKLLDFSENPTIDEFDKYHCCYAYNSTVKTNSPPDTPVFSHQGVSDGVLNYKNKDKGTKPIFKDKVLVLMKNGAVISVPANRKGILSTNEISADMWKKLVD